MQIAAVSFELLVPTLGRTGVAGTDAACCSAWTPLLLVLPAC